MDLSLWLIILLIAIIAGLGAYAYYRYRQPPEIVVLAPELGPIRLLAVDTAGKRSSVIHTLGIWSLAYLVPDGVIDQGDRQHIVGLYSGVLAGPPVPTFNRERWLLYTNQIRIAPTPQGEF